MPDFLTDIFLQLGLGLLLGVLASLAVTPLCKPLGLIDQPGTALHKQHARPTPLAGGLVILASLTILFLVFPDLLDSKMRGAALAGAVILAFGLWDDISGLSAGIKFVGQFLAAGIAITAGIRIEFLSDVLPSLAGATQFLNLAMTVFWLVGITNAFNLIDSMDGIVAGLSALASAFFLLVTIQSGQPELTGWAAILTGLSLALLFWNSSPAHYFLGDSGAQTLGFLLAILALLYNPVDKPPASSWFAPILILGVPIFDTTLVVFSRLRRRLHPFEGNRDHTYHRLMHLGTPPSRAVSLLHLTALILDIIAILAVSQPPLQANLIFAACLLAGGSLVAVLDYNRLFIPQPQDSVETK
jgi:UDP-GlcNAc:undecaprenyl-phosphate GlcNAc-1-phosphate transferase